MYLFDFYCFSFYYGSEYCIRCKKTYCASCFDIDWDLCLRCVNCYGYETQIRQLNVHHYTCFECKQDCEFILEDFERDITSIKCSNCNEKFCDDCYCDCQDEYIESVHGKVTCLLLELQGINWELQHFTDLLTIICTYGDGCAINCMNYEQCNQRVVIPYEQSECYFVEDSESQEIQYLYCGECRLNLQQCDFYHCDCMVLPQFMKITPASRFQKLCHVHKCVFGCQNDSKYLVWDEHYEIFLCLLCDGKTKCGRDNCLHRLVKFGNDLNQKLKFCEYEKDYGFVKGKCHQCNNELSISQQCLDCHRSKKCIECSKYFCTDCCKQGRNCGNLHDINDGCTKFVCKECKKQVKWNRCIECKLYYCHNDCFNHLHDCFH